MYNHYMPNVGKRRDGRFYVKDDSGKMLFRIKRKFLSLDNHMSFRDINGAAVAFIRRKYF